MKSPIGRLKALRRHGRRAVRNDNGEAILNEDPTRRQWFKGAAGVAVGTTAFVAEALRSPSASAQGVLVVDTVSDQSIGGIKTFTSPPVVPPDAFDQTRVAGLVADLANKQTIIPSGTYVGPAATVAGALAGTVIGSGKVTGDAQDRWRIDAAGRLYAGGGAAVPDLALTLDRLAVGVGRFALGSNAADNNVGVGVQALRNTTTGDFNTAVGRDTLVNNLTGQQNTAIGYAAMALATGSFNTAIGASALVNAIGNSNTAVGVQALQNLTSGEQNTGVGSQALQLCVTGSFNTAVGQAAMGVATTASYCVAIGQDALAAITTATDCTAIGEAAMPSNTTGYGNTAIGHGALRDNTTGAANIAIGVVTLQSSNTDANTAVGQNALQQMTTGTEQTALGYRAGATPNDVGANATTTGTRQTLVGALTGLSSATQRDDIVCVGHAALAGGNGAIALGSGAQALHAGSVAVGMGTVTTAVDQVALGARALTAASATLTGALTAASATLTECSLGAFGPGGEAGLLMGSSGDSRIYRRTTNEANIALNGTESVRWSPPGAGEAAVWFSVNDGAVTSLRRVTVAAADSGGTGKRLLVVAN